MMRSIPSPGGEKTFGRRGGGGKRQGTFVSIEKKERWDLRKGKERGEKGGAPGKETDSSELRSKGKISN